MEMLWLTVGLLFGVCFCAIGLGCYQLRRVAECELSIREIKTQLKIKPAK